MVRSPYSGGAGVKKGPWTVEEDRKLIDFVSSNGHGSWRALPKLAGLNRDGKSCRLRWTNYLRPDIKRGKFSDEEEQLVIELHSVLGNKWSAIATRLPGRTDNEIKNYWNTHIRKKLIGMGIDPVTHRPRPDLTLMASLPGLLAAAVALPPPLADATQLARLHLAHTLVQFLGTGSSNCVTNNGSLLYNNNNNQSNYGFSNLMNTIGFLHPPDQTPSITYGSRSLIRGDELQVPMISGDGSLSNLFSSFNNHSGTGTVTSMANSTASLASTSPENLVVDQTIKFHNSDHGDVNFTIPSNESVLISESFDGLDHLDDDLISGEPFWNQILSQVSSPTWTHQT